MKGCVGIGMAVLYIIIFQFLVHHAFPKKTTLLYVKWSFNAYMHEKV